MLKKLLSAYVGFFYGSKLRKRAKAISEENAHHAGRYVAARYTRGNVAIQQGRYSTKKHS